MLTRWRRRLTYWLHRGERAQQLREEMEFHLAMKTEENLEEGMTERDARAAAQKEFGNLTRQQEESRGTWIARWVTDLAQDLRYAARTIRKEPGFAATAALSASLGIGACTLIFGLASFALLQPLPVEDSGTLMSISRKGLKNGKTGQAMAFPDFEDLRRTAAFEGMTAYYPFMPASIASGGEARRYWGSMVTANYFDVVRPRFAAGRGFAAGGDDKVRGPAVVVLSYQLWTSHFSGDPGIVGREIELNRQKMTVLGVTAQGFRGTELGFYSDFWLPFSALSSLADAGMPADRLHDRGNNWLQAAGRLKRGVGQAAAEAEVDAVGHHLASAHAATNKDRGFYLERAGQAHPGFRRMVTTFFALLMAVAVLVLCTACANVANLLLARSSARHREVATRLAIGAGRGRLIRQLLTESVLLSLMGGAGGYALAHLGTIALSQARIPIAMPVDLSIALDARVLLFSILLSAVTGLLFGLVPALRATRTDLTSALKEEKASGGPARVLNLRDALVVGQVAICMVLLISSGLFLRSLGAAHNIDPGFTHRNVLMLSFDPGLNRYALPETRRLMDSMLESARTLPGVESASLTNSVPLSAEGTRNAFKAEGDTAESGTSAEIYAVAPGFFDTLGIRRISGEDFRPGLPAEDVVIVNQAAASTAFPGQDPVGRYIFYQGRRVRILGQVATTKSRSIGEQARPALYFPLAREAKGNDSLTGMTLMLRTQGPPANYAQQARQAIRSLDPGLAVFNVTTMDEHLSQALLVPRVIAYLFGLAGLMGLLIATVGVYGLVSFAVARQTKEIGIRMALGARRSQVVLQVLRRGLLLTAVGASLGLGVSLALSQTAASLLYGISPTDAVTFTAVPALLMLIVLAACLVPARRAATLDPLRALRYE